MKTAPPEPTRIQTHEPTLRQTARRWRERPFDDLAPRDEASAWRLVNEWLGRRHGNIPRWLYPKLIERAYRFVEDPHAAIRLAAASGGHALARRYPGKLHPIHKARQKMLQHRRTQKEIREREETGLPPKSRTKWLELL